MSLLEKTQESNQYDTTNCAPERLVFKLYNRAWPNANYLQTSIPITLINAGGTFTQNVLGTIVNGSGNPGTRTGRNIRLKHMLYNFSSLAPNVNATAVEWRVIIFMAQNPYTTATPPTYSPDVCLTFTPNAMYNPTNCDKNIIIYDSGYQSSTGDQNNRGWCRQISIPLNKITSYQSSSGTADSITTNNIWIVVCNFDATQQVQIKGDGLIFYES